MSEYMLSDLIWVYNLETSHLSAFVKNSSSTRVKDIGSGTIYDIPKRHGDYGSEYRLDFRKILNTSDCIEYKFEQIYGLVGINAFLTLKGQQKQVDKEMKRIIRDTNNDYYAHELPGVNANQYISESDLLSATRRAETILRENKDVQRRERDCKNKTNLDF